MNCKWNFWAAGVLVLVAAAIPVAGQSNVAGPPTPEQLARQAETMQRLMLAEQIVARDEATLERTYDKDFRTQIVRALGTLSINDLNAIPTGGAVVAAIPLAPGLGDSGDNLVYTPVTPCRIIDTRLAGGPIPAGGQRAFRATGSGFGGQGGVAGSCGIPFGPATAVVINFVSVNASGIGDLRVWPFGQPVPLAAAINYVLPPNNAVANGFPQAICIPGLCPFDIAVQSDNSSTDLVADVEGYFAAPLAPVTQNLFAVVNGSTATLVTGQSFRATAVTRLGTGIYQVDFNRNITNCAYTATQGDPGAASAPAGFVGVTGRAGDVDGLFIITYDATAAVVDRNFHVHVLCPSGPSSP
jgi:hypothetical protein